MKKYLYHGSSILAFTHKDKDHVVFGSGPHSLPEDSDRVTSLVAQGILSEVVTQTKNNNSKN